MPKPVFSDTQLVGQQFGRLTIINPAPRTTVKRQFYCQCSCGSPIRVVGLWHLTSGHTTSCGCLCRENHTTHGHKKNNTYTKAYAVWSSMKRRCLSSTDKAYPRYGGRGIKVCKRWSESFEAFLFDMGEPPACKSLDRIDNNGDYDPLNCRWATVKQQGRNRSTTVHITLHGVTMPLAEWSEKLGIKYVTIYQRYKKGQPIDAPLSRGRTIVVKK